MHARVPRALLSLADGDRHLYHSRDTHLNASGNWTAELALAEFLEAQLESSAPRVAHDEGSDTLARRNRRAVALDDATGFYSSA